VKITKKMLFGNQLMMKATLTIVIVLMMFQL